MTMRWLCGFLLLVVTARPALAAGEPQCASPLMRGTPGIWCRVGLAETVLGIFVAPGSFVKYDANGVLQVLSLKKPAMYGELYLAGQGDGPHQVFRPDGTPEMLWLAEAHDVQGVPCAAVSFVTEVAHRSSRVLFHPNGRLRECRASREVVLHGVRFGRASLIQLDPAGHLLAAKP